MNDLRPTRFSEFIGQKDLVFRLKTRLKECKAKGNPLDHVLLNGPPGLGKTTLAYCIAAELNLKIYTTIGSVLRSIPDAIEFTMQANNGAVLFIDEIHRVPSKVQEFLYPVLEDSCVVTGENNFIKIGPLTVIGATTESGKLTKPFRDRFPIRETIDFYTNKELERLVVRNAATMGMTLEVNVAGQIAGISRGTPRIANNHLKWIRAYAHSKNKKRIGLSLMLDAMKEQGIDTLGLDKQDRRVLTALEDQSMGLDSLATTTQIAKETVADEIEPWLLECKLIKRTKQGRKLTEKGIEYMAWNRRFD